MLSALRRRLSVTSFTTRTLTRSVRGEPSAFTIEAALVQTSASIGDATRTIGADFPAPIDTSGADLTTLEGVEYPSVHGAPYRSQGFKIGEIGGDNYDRVVIAGHDWPVLTNIYAYADGVLIDSTTGMSTATTSSSITQIYAAVEINSAGGTSSPAQATAYVSNLRSFVAHG